jgi:hypothetical protein
MIVQIANSVNAEGGWVLGQSGVAVFRAASPPRFAESLRLSGQSRTFGRPPRRLESPAFQPARMGLLRSGVPRKGEAFPQIRRQSRSSSPRATTLIDKPGRRPPLQNSNWPATRSLFVALTALTPLHRILFHLVHISRRRKGELFCDLTIWKSRFDDRRRGDDHE